MFKKNDPETQKKVYKGGRSWAKSAFDGKKDKTYADVGRAELERLLRKLRPHTTKAIMTMLKVMENPEASEAGKLRAAVVILTEYRGLVKDAYDSEQPVEENHEDLDPPEKKPSTVLQLRVVEKAAVDKMSTALDEAAKTLKTLPKDEDETEGS